MKTTGKNMATLQIIVDRQQSTVFRDDGCNTNVISKLLVDGRRGLVQSHNPAFTISHSANRAAKEASEIMLTTELQTGTHKYRSQWVVVSCRYETMFIMPWHVVNKPRTEYETGNQWIRELVLPDLKDSSSSITGQNLGVNKVTSSLRRTEKKSNKLFISRLQLE